MPAQTNSPGCTAAGLLSSLAWLRLCYEEDGSLPWLDGPESGVKVAMGWETEDCFCVVTARVEAAGGHSGHGPFRARITEVLSDERYWGARVEGVEMRVDGERLRLLKWGSDES